ncbi:MAG: SUMF1/EgtB/PvdO family nonheme iron enzyme [Pirellulales bacterium]
MKMSLAAFSEQLAASGLIPADELAAFLDTLPAERKADGEQLARELVRQKKLTAFQAQQIYQGKGKHLVLGNYVALDKLGQGGMGMVLKAEHRRMKRQVALKVLSPNVTKTPEALRRFQREVEAAAKLNHTNIVTAHDADEAGGTHFLVMEYVEGTDLADVVKKNGPMPIDKALSCVIQTARGLEYAHARGVVHRDIKPANLLLDREGTIKILDMGLARLDSAGGQQDQLTGTGQIMGTVDYMAPEQAMDTKSADARADIYSLGVTLWYLLTGRPLYDGDTTVMKLMAHQNKPIPSLREVCPAVSAELEAVFSRMVAKTPEARYQSMKDVIADLERCRTGEASSPSVGTGPGEDSRLTEFLGGMGQAGAGHGTAVAGHTKNAAAPTTALEQTVNLSDARIGTDPRTQRLLPQTALGTLIGGGAVGLGWLERLPVPPKYRLPVLIGGGLAAAALLLVAGILLFWQTDQGTVRIEINDPKITVQVDGTGAKITQLDKDPIELAPGQHGLRIKVGDLEFESDKFVLADGDDVRLRIELLDGQVQVANGDEPLGVNPMSSSAVASSTSASGGRQPPGDRTSGAGWHGWPADAPAPAIAPFDAAQAKRHQEEWADYLGVPVEYENSIGMKFVLIPPGEFQMGSTPEEIEAALVVGRPDDEDWNEKTRTETPRHTVALTQPFYLGTFEVTQAQYENVMGVNPSHFAAKGAGKDAVAGLDTSAHPVEMVSWNDAVEFSAKLSLIEELKSCYFRSADTVTTLDGNGYRLPTEAQWEFACRAGTTTKYWFGDQEEVLVQAGWFGKNSGLRTHAEGELKANPLGLFDMFGNVWEWVQDGWEPAYYAQFQDMPAINPSGPSPTLLMRVVRGGFWNFMASQCRASSRYALLPHARRYNLGFRATLSVEAVKKVVTEPATQTTTGTSSWHGWPADSPAPAIATFDAAQAKRHQEEWAVYLGVPVEYENLMGMKFRLIPPGEFLMGSTPEEIEAALVKAGSDERWKQYVRSEAPQHTVALTQAFYLGVHEVTQAQYENVKGTNQFHFSASGPGKDAVVGLDTSAHPAEMVSWNDAAEFCAKLSEKESLKPFYFRSGETVELLDGNGYRLPTEAEWAFACRAGTTTRFWCAEADDDLLHAGWCRSNSGGRTHAVGELKANPLGLYDIHGNVWEWVQDWWDADYYARFQEDPVLDPIGPSSAGSQRVIRGGYWNNNPSRCRSSNRVGYEARIRHIHIGFRVALAVEAVEAVKAAVAKRATPAADATGTWHGWPADAPAPAIAPFDAAQAKKHQEEWAAYLKLPVEYENSIGMKFVLIPPGEFTMGSTAEEIEAALEAAGEDTWRKGLIPSEAPQHKVILTTPIYMGMHEVTQKQYEQVMGKNPSHFAKTGAEAQFVEAVTGLDTAEHPVEGVTWNDAAEFCAKLSAKEERKPFYLQKGEAVAMLEGTGYRLPTEAEWEFACRAGTTTRFWSGDRDEDVVRAGWIGSNSGGRTHAVGSMQANPLGLFDMHGNVWEWCQDWADENYYRQFAEQPAIDPTGPFASDSQRRVIRGGNWFYTASGCRSSYRNGGDPTHEHFLIGFRVALPVDAVKSTIKGNPTP